MKKIDVFHIYDERLVGEAKYIVKKGDTLYKIAKKNNVLTEDLVSINNLSSNLIYPNQVIVIPKIVPGGSVYFEEYIVQSDDTMEKIAEKLAVRLDMLIKYNDVTKLLLAENQVIRIPKRFNNYMIKENDTLQSILTNTNMSLEELVEANSGKWLAPGMMIHVK